MENKRKHFSIERKSLLEDFCMHLNFLFFAHLQQQLDKVCKIWPTIGKIHFLNCFFCFVQCSIDFTHVKRFEKVKDAPSDDRIVVTANDNGNYGGSESNSAQVLKILKVKKIKINWKFQSTRASKYLPSILFL